MVNIHAWCVVWIVCVVSLLKLSFIEIFFVFLLGLFVNGREDFTHPWEGRDTFSEGIIWAQQYSWEILPCEEMVLVCSWSMGSIEVICLLYFGRYKCVCVKRRIYWKPWRGMLQICIFYICYEDRTIFSLESPPSPHVLGFLWWINV